MKTVVITSQKGGSGKTTLTAHLGVAAEQSKAGQCVMLDTDPQQTLATWWNLRESDGPQLARVTLRDLPNALKGLTERFQYCFIDTPPALTEQNRAVLKLADLVIIPTRPSPNDLWSLGATLDLVKESGTPFVFTLTQAKANARITVQTIAALSQHGQVFPAIIHDRVDYAASMTDGRSAIEINPNGLAASEIAQLWKCTEKRVRELAKVSEVVNPPKKVKMYA